MGRSAEPGRSGVAVLLLAALLQGCFGAPLSPGPVPDVQVIHSGTFLRVACHFECGDLGRETLRTGELAWRWTAVVLGVEPDPSDAPPPTVHLFASRADYQTAEARIGGGEFHDRNGFSSREHRAAFVFVPAELPRPYLERTGLPLSTRRNIAHEAAHLASYELAFGAYWPPWLAEGLAGWVEREAVVRPAGVGFIEARNPWAATHLWRVQRLLQADLLPTVPDLMTGAPLPLSLEDAYAVWTEVFDYLVRGPFSEETRLLVHEVAATRIPEARAWPAVAEVAERTFGRDRMEEADAGFRSHVQRRRPGWVEVFRSVDPAAHGPDTWLQYAETELPVGALVWRMGDPGEADGFVVEGRVRPLGGDPWEVRVSLAPVEGASLLVAIASDGHVRLIDLDLERPDRLSVRASDRFGTSAPFPGPEALLSVRFVPGEIRVAVDGRPSDVSFEAPDLRPAGLWGIGVAPGTPVVWEGLRASSVDMVRPDP